MKLKQLEMALQRLEGFSNPDAALEQYVTPAPLAARLLFHAAMKGDIGGKTICDLGSGTGILAIGAALLGAVDVVGVEIDAHAAGVARANADLIDVDVDFIVADIREPEVCSSIGKKDTVVMNPPFGAQNVHADRPFIDCALAAAPVIYGIFNAGSCQFIQTYTAGRATISETVGTKLSLRRTFSFHTRDVLEIGVEILRLTRNP
ncbi:MAG TPA: METTL5 family protein [Methanoregulaceae archaeon]|nr:METTL5 family protein [Methanoregulaceae archaeon]